MEGRVQQDCCMHSSGFGHNQCCGYVSKERRKPRLLFGRKVRKLEIIIMYVLFKYTYIRKSGALHVPEDVQYSVTNLRMFTN